MHTDTPKKRLAAVLFVALVITLLALLCSCSSDFTAPDTDAVTDEQTSPASSRPAVDSAADTEVGTNDLPLTPVPGEPSDWGGASLTVLCPLDDCDEDIFNSDDVSSDTYDSLVFERNEKIEKTLNVKLVRQTTEDVAKTIKESIDSMSCPDVVYANGTDMSDMMMYGHLDELYKYGIANDASLGVSVSAMRQLSVYGKIYMITGAPIRSSVSSAAVVSCNEDILREIGYESGYVEQLVTLGKWSYDVMLRLVREASDGERSLDSLVGGENALYLLWKGMGAKTVTKSTGDVPTVTVYDPRNVFYFEKTSQMGAYHSKDAQNTLFYISSLGEANNTAGGSRSIVPLPSYNCGEYTSVLEFSDTFFTAIPMAASAKEMSLEFLSQFYTVSISEFYLLTASELDIENDEIFEIILSSRYFDFLDMYGVGHIVSSAFDTNTDKGGFDQLLKDRAKFASEVLDIALKQTVGQNTDASKN